MRVSVTFFLLKSALCNIHCLSWLRIAQAAQLLCGLEMACERGMHGQDEAFSVLEGPDAPSTAAACPEPDGEDWEDVAAGAGSSDEGACLQLIN